MPDKQTPGPMRQFIADDYLTPWGTELTPEDFVPLAAGSEHGGWTVSAMDLDGRVHEFRLEMKRDGYRAAGFRDGERIYDVRDPFTKQVLHLSQPPEWWYDRILSRDAQARIAGRRRPEAWESEDLEGAMTRMEMNAVAYRDERRSADSFQDLAHFQSWFDEFLAESPIDVEIRKVTTLPSMDLDFDEAVVLMGIHPGEDGDHVFYIPQFLREDRRTSHWFRTPDDPALARVDSFVIEASGRQVGGFATDGAASWEALVAAGAFEKPDTGGFGFDDWWVLHVVGTDIALIIPRHFTMLDIVLDRDGAELTVHATDKEIGADALYVEDRFRRQWGKWLDDTVELTEEEVSEGIERAEALAAAAQAGEVTE